MAVGSIEIKQVQRTINNGAVTDAEQVQVKGRLPAPAG